MRIVMLVGIAMLCSTSLLANPTTLPANSNDQSACLTANLDTTLQPNQNAVWGASLPITWNEFVKRCGGTANFASDDPDAVGLMMTRFPRSWAGEADLIAEAGERDIVVSRVEAQLLQKFSGSADPKLLDLIRPAPPETFVLYAYLQKNLKFANAFPDVAGGVEFQATAEPSTDTTRCFQAFGVNHFAGRNPAEEKAAKQVSILWYAPPDATKPAALPDECVIELKTSTPSDRLILARLNSPLTLRSAIDAAMEHVRHPSTSDISDEDIEMEGKKFAKEKGDSATDEDRHALFVRIVDLTARRRSMCSDEKLEIPLVKFDITRSFNGLLGQPIKTENGSLPGLAFLEERAAFALNAEGVSLKSEAGGALFGGMSRDFTFDRPFLIMLVRADAPFPYFAAWIGNTEFFNAIAGDSPTTQPATTQSSSAKVSEFQGEYRFLSNFWPAEVVYEGITYPTAEHAYQAAKTLDRDQRKKIAALKTPAEAKHAGEAFKARDDWPDVKFKVMEDVVRCKFTHHDDLRAKLLATGDAALEEGNTWNDRIWGISPPNSGQGENHLGKILMKIRAELKSAPVRP